MRDFDCFGMVPLVFDIIAAFGKALFYILISGVSSTTCVGFIEVVACNGMAGCIGGGALLSFFRYTRGTDNSSTQTGTDNSSTQTCTDNSSTQTGTDNSSTRIATTTICVSFVLFLVVVFLFFLCLQTKWNVEEEGAHLTMMCLIIFVQLWQLICPVFKYMMHGHVPPVEPTVVALKCLASLILIFTSWYDARSLEKNLDPLMTQQSVKLHRAMCWTGAAIGVLQLIMRICLVVKEHQTEITNAAKEYIIEPSCRAVTYAATQFKDLKDKFMPAKALPH